MSQEFEKTSDGIGGNRYIVSMLDPLTAADLLADIGYMVAPVAGSIGGAFATKPISLKSLFNGEASDIEGLDKMFETAVIGFFNRFTKAKQREIIAILASVTRVVLSDGKEPQLSNILTAHFRGKIKSMYQWIAFAMKVQFSDFFTGPGGDISAFISQETNAR